VRKTASMSLVTAGELITIAACRPFWRGCEDPQRARLTALEAAFMAWRIPGVFPAAAVLRVSVSFNHDVTVI